MSLQDFRDDFPEFSSVEDSRVENALAEAASLHSRTSRGLHLVTAHLLSLDAESLSGEVNMVSVGDQSLGTGMSQAERGRETFFTRTVYGQRYLAFRKSNAVGMMFNA